MLDLYQYWTSFTKSSILSGDSKFDCGTPGQVGPTDQVLSESCCYSYTSIASIKAEIVSYADKKKKKKK